MNPEIKARWVQALRSGEYAQGTEALRSSATDDRPWRATEVTHCCLGVLCDIHRKDGGAEWDTTYQSNTYFGAADVLPEEVMAWAGLSETDPVLDIHDNVVSASIHNDGSSGSSPGRSFIEIAYAIEEQL